MFLNPSIEQLARPKLAQLQNERFKAMLARVYEKSLFYAQRLDELGLKPADCQSLTDIAKLPFTTDTDMVENYPYGLLTMPVSGVARFETNRKIALGLTGQDIYQQIETTARSLVACNIIKGSVIMPLSDTTACRAVQAAAEGIGATAVNDGIAASKDRLAALLDFGVSVLSGTREDIAEFAALIQKQPANEAPLLLQRILVCTKEYPLPKTFTSLFKVPMYALITADGIAPSGLGSECYCQQGCHVYEDCFYIETIDSTTNKAVPRGQPGELVVTTLTREAMPLIRYRTGRRAILDDRPCPCGRTSMRITKLT